MYDFTVRFKTSHYLCYKIAAPVKIQDDYFGECESEEEKELPKYIFTPDANSGIRAYDSRDGKIQIFMKKHKFH